MRRFQHGSLFKLKRKSCPDVWVFRWYDSSTGKRIRRKQIIGNVTKLRNRGEAEKAVMALRSSINVDVGIPRSICDLAAHYRLHELTRERKAFTTIESHRALFKRHIEPRWGHLQLSAVRTMQVETWLDSLRLAPKSKAKLKSILSVLYNHAIRHEWLTFNPISRVRVSQKRLRDKDVLTPEEFQSLVEQLPVRDRAIAMLVGSTGLRRSEWIALTWSDLDVRTMEVRVLRSCVRNRFGKTKTEVSCRPVPLHPIVLNALLNWRAESLYATDADFLFPSIRHKGLKPLSPDHLLKKNIRPALIRAGIVGKQIGWHSFRHSLATNLRALGVDIKVAQELMRHASSRTTLDIYTQAVSQQKREANAKVVERMLPLEMRKFRDPSGPSEIQKPAEQPRHVKHCKRFIGGPDRDRTDDLFHAMLTGNCLILKVFVALESPQKSPKIRLLLRYCSNQALIAPMRHLLYFQ